MAISINDELDQIGKALAAASGGEPIELTDEQREVLAHAAFPDTLDAILAHAPIHSNSGATPPIAKAWSDELRAAFRLQSITDKIAADDSLQTVQSIVSQDDRLSTEEKEVLLSALPEDGKEDRYLLELRSMVLQDDQLSGAEKHEILSELADFERQQQPTDSGSTSLQLSTSSRPRAYLESILVEGFRGIGERVNLPFAPQRGLTLIYGANGSGKSTFVEALDVLLTGSTARFAGRSREWRSAWANAHSPDRGQIDAKFIVEDRGIQHDDTLTCDWTAASLSAATDESNDPPVKPAQRIGRLNISSAVDEFRPILGYGELGPLFDETGSPDDRESDNVTPFAQHIRARANVRDGTTDALWDLIKDHKHRNAFSEELSAWQSCVSEARKGTKRESPLRSVVMGDVAVKANLRSPSSWNWQAFATEYMHTETLSDSVTKDRLLEIARAYFPRFSHPIRSSIAQAAAWVASDDRKRFSGEGENLDLHFYGLNLMHTRAEFLAYTPRVKSYAEMLLDEIHNARLEQFSQRVSDIWQRIRRDSGVRFETLSLQQRRQINKFGRIALELRVSLGLTIDGDLPIERGALSQGELHSLALSVFLPALMRPESPFGFAVIDDPVQAMDEYAVDGLAEVLRDAAEELQVIVFTHDDRLPRALRLLDIEHTLINVTRSAGSVVRCEVALDSVTRALRNADIQAQEASEDNSASSWMYLGVHCREAVEEACIKAATQRLRKAGVSLSDIQHELDSAVYNERLTTRRLMALAIWGYTVDNPTDVEKHLAGHEVEHTEGKVSINDWIGHTNDLYHRNREQVPTIRATYMNDPGYLVEVTRGVVKWIEENCG